MPETNYILPDNEEQIIKGCLAGNRALQAKLYQMYSHKMMGVCMWYARNREEAEEILQDGFMRVFTYMHTYKQQGSLEGWIRKIIVNAALLKYRNKSSRLSLVIAFDANKHDLREDINLFNRLEEQELVKMVQSLSPAYRMVFNLYVFEGLKHREIAELLDISEGTSKSNLYAARAILQKKLSFNKKAASS